MPDNNKRFKTGRLDEPNPLVDENMHQEEGKLEAGDTVTPMGMTPGKVDITESIDFPEEAVRQKMLDSGKKPSFADRLLLEASTPRKRRSIGDETKVSLEFLERLAERFSEIQEGFLELKPGQVIQEFRVCAEDASSQPFEYRSFLRLASFREFNYRVMSASTIVTFLEKRFDLTETADAHPALTAEQCEVRHLLDSQIAKYRESSSAAI